MKKLELDVNQFHFDTENGETITVEVLDNEGEFKILTKAVYVSECDFVDIQHKAYSFEYMGYTKPYDKHWND